MAVLIEGISVVVRAERIVENYPGGWEAFVTDCPNDSLCADGELARVGFMSPSDTKNFVSRLTSEGLIHFDEGEARDLVVADQQRGFAVPCEWAELFRVPPPGKETERIVVCQAAGSDSRTLVTPDGWKYEESLSANFGYAEADSDRLEFLRHEDGVDVYRDTVTGEEVYVGRSSGDSSS